MSEVFTPARYKLSIEDYHKLGEAGILNEDSRVELIEGELIEMAPIGGTHLWVVNNLNDLLHKTVGNRAAVSVQNPVSLPPDSEPQPDLSLVKRKTRGSRSTLPTPANTFLIIEVADTTLKYDRGTKLLLYAQAGVVECWIVNIDAQCVEVYREPAAEGYVAKQVVKSGEQVAPAAFPDALIDVADIFA